MTSETPKTKCHFCGFEYTEDMLKAKCEHCPLNLHHSGMGVSCCPNCGIEVKMSSPLLDLLSKWTQKGKIRKP